MMLHNRPQSRGFIVQLLDKLTRICDWWFDLRYYVGRRNDSVSIESVCTWHNRLAMRVAIADMIDGNIATFKKLKSIYCNLSPKFK